MQKSARADTGQYLDGLTGEVVAKAGSWDKYQLEAELGGPLVFFQKEAGFYLYAELENSESFFNYDATRENLFQGTLNLEMSDSFRIEIGFMSQFWRGHENGGWNRVTQDLINRQAYITGEPFVDIDSQFGDADGLMSEREIDRFESAMFDNPDGGLGYSGDEPFGQSQSSVTCFEGLTAFCIGGVSSDNNEQVYPIRPEDITQLVIDRLNGSSQWLALDPSTVSESKLGANQVLIDAEDFFNTDAHVFYFDAVYSPDSDLQVSNKLFVEIVEYSNSDAYGFTKIAEAYVVEEQLIIKKKIDAQGLQTDLYLSPSIRYTNSFFALDFGDEVFDRVDLTRGFNGLSRQSTPLSNARIGETWSHWYQTDYYQYGIAALANLEFDAGLELILGSRYDYVDINAEDGDGPEGPIDLRNFDGGERLASGAKGSFTWSMSISYPLFENVYPYASHATQSSLTSAEVGNVDPGLVETDSFLGDSRISELGVKSIFYEGRLFLALARFEQERQSLRLQGPINNQSTKAQGFELEARLAPIDGFTLSMTYSNYEILVHEPNKYTYTYLGASNLVNVDPSTFFGGIVGADVYVSEFSARGGIPESSWGISGTQSWTDQFRTSFSWTWVAETHASVLPGILLPQYSVLNVNAVYEKEQSRLGLYFSNIGDELYFRGNYPSLYGNNTVLPSLPFHWLAEWAYKF